MSASIHTNQILLSSNRLELSTRSFTLVFKKIETTMRWNCLSKTLRFLQIMAKHQPFFTVFLTIKTSSQNISITLLQFSLKLYQQRGDIGGKSYLERFWKNSSQHREVLLQVKQVMASFRCYVNCYVIATMVILTNFHLYLIQLWWQFLQNLCLRRRSLYSNLGDIDAEKLYRATLNC